MRAKPNRPLSASGERGKKKGAYISPKNQKGASVSANPPVSPSARLPIRETGALRRRQAWSTTGKGRGAVRSSVRRASAGRSPGRGRPRRAAVPPRCPCDPFAPRGAPASRSGHRSARSRRVVSLDGLAPVLLPEGFQYRRGCGCIFPTLPEGSAAPLQPAPPGPKTGFASGLPVWSRRPKASVPSLPPVIPGTRPKDAIGRLSVPFPQSRCEHRLCGFPGWRPRPDLAGFPKAPATIGP